MESVKQIIEELRRLEEEYVKRLETLENDSAKATEDYRKNEHEISTMNYSMRKMQNSFDKQVEKHTAQLKILKRKRMAYNHRLERLKEEKAHETSSYYEKRRELMEKKIELNINLKRKNNGRSNDDSGRESRV